MHAILELPLHSMEQFLIQVQVALNHFHWRCLLNIQHVHSSLFFDIGHVQGDFIDPSEFRTTRLGIVYNAIFKTSPRRWRRSGKQTVHRVGGNRQGHSSILSMNIRNFEVRTIVLNRYRYSLIALMNPVGVNLSISVCKTSTISQPVICGIHTILDQFSKGDFSTSRRNCSKIFVSITKRVWDYPVIESHNPIPSGWCAIKLEKQPGLLLSF